jgi:hypothetical protein
MLPEHKQTCGFVLVLLFCKDYFGRNCSPTKDIYDGKIINELEY